MTNALIMAGGLALIVLIFGLLDWYTRRKDQQSHAPRS